MHRHAAGKLPLQFFVMMVCFGKGLAGLPGYPFSIFDLCFLRSSLLLCQSGFEFALGHLPASLAIKEAATVCA
jgi:hypothetical protein